MVKQRKGVKEELIVPIRSMEPKSNIPTPEQMRIAQILEKKVVDSAIKLKIKQIMDATQRSADEVYVALHDSDFDENRAVDLLIEGEDQLAHWCTNEKKKKKLVEMKEKKEEPVEPEVPQEKKDPIGGRGDNKKRPGRRQVGGRQPQKPVQDEPRRPPVSFDSRAPKGKRPGSSGFGSLVFERSNPPPIDPGFLPPVKNQWEKPLVRTTNGLEDEWDCEEYQGSLSQTQIFTSSKRPEPQEILEEDKTPEVQSRSLLSSLTFTNKTHDHRDFVSSMTPQKMNSATDVRPNTSSSQERPAVMPSPERAIVISSQDRPSIMPSQDRSSIMPTHDRPSVMPLQERPNLPLPAESRTEYVHQLNYAKFNHPEERRPPSKIPTLPVEMPPELKPSLSFLDIQFGAMDLGPSETSSDSQNNHSNIPSQNPSATTLMPSSSLPSSSSSITHLMANASITSSSTNTVVSSIANASTCSPLNSSTCSNSSGMRSITNPPGMNGISSPPGISSATSPPGLNISNSITTPGISSINTSNVTTSVNQSLNSIANTALNNMTNSNNFTTNNLNTTNSIPPVNLVPPSSISGSISHLMGQSSIQQAGANVVPSNNMPNASHMVPNTIGHTYGSTSNQRYLPSSQAFNSSHLQYGIINPPVSTHGYESRDNAPPAPPHIPQTHTHLPPFKSPPGVPKGAMVPNLPPGSLMSNQYIVGQGNVPYFPHPPIYYYEEVPPLLNSQQRLASMTSHPHHYDVTYQTAPSSRDSVHYNV